MSSIINILDNSPINIPSILIANAMGIAILFVVAVGNPWRYKKTFGESKALFIMFICSISNCIVDPICFLIDGKAGLLNRILAFGCNTTLYVAGILIAYYWVNLVASHLKVKPNAFHTTLIRVILGGALLLLLVNLFVPVVFVIDQANVYSRIAGYWVYMGFYFFLMMDGFVFYLRQRRASGGLKFFPVWAFISPALCGIVVQALWYGISTATPFVTVSIVCVILCLQNELMLRDKLTGLYNRFYLNMVEARLLRYPFLKYSAIMLDINGFKKINDNYGHKVGDDALIRVSGVLTTAVGKLGEVVRYAGDEFIIILNTQDETKIESIISLINSMLKEFDKKDDKLYGMSVATGYCPLDLSENSMDAYMDKIDELMYGDKRKYYQAQETKI